ncbi:MAG: lytic transglycosylase domain-containing protein [Pseudomonadota bacterium]
MKSGLFGFGALIGALPLHAQGQAPDPLAPLTQADAQATKPAQQSTQAPLAQPVPARPPIVVPKDWRGVFDAIDAGNWASAQAGITALPSSVLTPLAKAELYTAKGSPTVSLPAIQALIAEAPELPQAEQLARMAQVRGAIEPLFVNAQRRTISLGSAPGRYRAKPVQGDPVADQLRDILTPYVKADDAAGAEAQFLVTAPQLSLEARAELSQRVAWIYYILGLDLDARRVADTWRPGATGEWASQAAWISALSSWRMGDCNSASRAFQQVASFTTQRELRAGGYYWAARAEQMCHRPSAVEPLLRLASAAAESAESFYGLIARECLGMPTKLPPDPLNGFDPPVDQLPNVRRATELARIGESGLAEEMLRHQAKIGLPTEHHALVKVARKLDLAAVQFWLATNGQPGARSSYADRYPNPKWTPLGGWRVDPALAYGHIVQESSFRRTAVSPADAVGLMQVRPGTARDMARARGTALGSLTDPATNLEYGQTFIEMMRRSSATAGQLPRVIASYNAGPLPVGRWATINDKGDPLLWIESIPYWETRFYVPAVLRNMWVYQGLNDQPTPTLRSVAQHRWPDFPTGTTRLSH